jgi:hypothetical protein
MTVVHFALAAQKRSYDGKSPRVRRSKQVRKRERTTKT